MTLRNLIQKNKTKMTLFLATLFTLLFSTEAFAHVKWVVDVHKVHNTTKDPMFTQLTVLNTTLGIITLVLLGALVALSVYLKINEKVQNWIARVIQIRPYVSTILSVTLGISLIAAGQGHVLFAPELALSDANSWLSMVQIVLGVLLIAGLFTRLSAAGTLLLYASGIFLYKDGMIDYIDLIGVCIYLIITGRSVLGLDNLLEKYFTGLKPEVFNQFDQYAMGILRIATGITLIWLGVDKWWHPDWAYAVISSHHLPLWGFSKELYVFGAGLVETAVGIGVLVGAVNRIIAVILALLFSVTAMVFQGEIIGHIVLFGVVFAMLVEGAGAWEIANLFSPAAKRYDNFEGDRLVNL